MNAFRGLLVLLWVILVVVTVVVVSNHGINLFPAFFGEMKALSWSGQFNTDFACYLTLTAVWLMWRHEFTPVGMVLGVAGFFGGASFLLAYLFIQSFLTKADVPEMMLGKRRSDALRAAGAA